jgi:hypothetical protein
LKSLPAGNDVGADLLRALEGGVVRAALHVHEDVLHVHAALGLEVCLRAW